MEVRRRPALPHPQIQIPQARLHRLELRDPTPTAAAAAAAAAAEASQPQHSPLPLPCRSSSFSSLSVSSSGSGSEEAGSSRGVKMLTMARLQRNFRATRSMPMVLNLLVVMERCESYMPITCHISSIIRLCMSWAERRMVLGGIRWVFLSVLKCEMLILGRR